jgi:ABC-type uncharacterized transport system involved in gliding motility auxiliary subunit
MSRWIRFVGIVGVVLLAFGVLGTVALGGEVFEWKTAATVLGFHFTVGFIGVAVWFALYGVKHLREAGTALTGRQARFGFNAIVYLIVFVGLITAANWFVVRHDKRWDFTEAGVYSLSEPSKRIVGMVKKPLKIVGFKVGDWEGVKDLLDLYGAQNSTLVTTELIDPRSKPHLVERYEMKPGNLVYLAYGEGETAAVSRVNETTEDAISNAILKLVRGEGRKIYYVEGHGEPSLESRDEGGIDQFISAIKDQQIAVESIIVSTKEKIPSDAAAVLLVSPKKTLLPQERTALINYAREGGRLVLFTDPRAPEDVAAIAKEFGIEVGNDVVLDQVQQLFSGPALAVQFAVQEYGEHPITANFGSESVTVVQLAKSIRASQNQADGAQVTDLLKSSARSFAMKKTELIFDQAQPRAERSVDDLEGPVSLATAYEKKVENGSKEGASSSTPESDGEKISRVVVVGDSDLIMNGAFNLYSNRDFGLNIVNWAAGEEVGVSIKPRVLKVASTPLQASVFKSIFVTSFLIPELVLLIGLFVWFARREVSLG